MKKMILIALATAGCQIGIAQQQVRIDTLHAYPAYKPYYFEMIVQTELNLVYMVNVCNEHGLQRRKWIQVKDPAGMALDARETEGFARFYFPELIGNYTLIESK